VHSQRRGAGASPYDRDILRLAIPAFGALVAEPLFLLADSAIVGRLGTEPLGGLGVAGTVLATVVNVCVFLAYGTTAAVARRLGAGDERAALRQGIDGLWLAVALGLALLAVAVPTAGVIIGALGASAGIRPYALTYLRLSLLGVPAMLVVLAGTGVLRGLHDTRTPLVVAVVGSAVNLGLNAVFVLGLGWGIAGSAAGTVLTQYASAAAYVAVVARGARRLGVSGRPRWSGLRVVAVAGVPLLLRTLTLRVALVVMTAVAARIGDVAIAAHQVVFGVWSLLALALDAVAIAAQAITGRALGAGDVAGARAATRRMVGWGVIAALGAALVVAVVSPVLPLLFSTSGAVRHLITHVLLVVAVLQPVAGIVFVLDGVLIGAGDGSYLARSGVWTLLAFLPVAGLVLVTHAGLVALWAAYGVFMTARLVVLTVRARGEAWSVPGAVR
jgi:putative MATE family efflux protein